MCAWDARDMKSKVRHSPRQLGAPTISDVARAAGVSPMTVSRVLNEPARVADTTKAAVLQVITRLNYKPNMAARSLAGAGPARIGLLLSNLGAGFLNDILLGCMSAASADGAQLLIENVDVEQEPVATARLLVDAGVDGIVLAPPLSEDAAIISLLSLSSVPFVTLTASSPKPGSLAVFIDDFEAAYSMTHHLLGLGHRRIGFIGGTPELNASVRRFEGYRAALAQAGVDQDPLLFGQGSYTYQSGMEAADKLLCLSARPTAIFACNDDMAAATVAVAHRLGINVPGDVTVCGFDDTMLATAIWPQLTTIRQPLRTMTNEAVLMLLRDIRIEGGVPDDARHQVFEFTLIRRQSDAAPKLPDHEIKKVLSV